MPEISAETAPNLPEYSVSELSNALKRTVEDAYSYVRVRGEVSGFKRAASGHLYLALKDEDAVLDGVCWRGVAGRLAIQPEDGMEVIATGKLTTYPGRSKYQIVIESMELAGEGALLKMLEDRRRKLAAEGLFDEARKKPIPYLPAVIGVVTSPTGAVIRDILHRLADRFPRHVLLAPVLVQGNTAAAQVVAAIEGFNRLAAGGDIPRPDVLIVARGGGSLEDLWAFNEEIVVRAVAASDIPVISAVGHETDTTLIDFASDRRAPTPTAAAEMAVPVRAELLQNVMDVARRMVGGMTRLIDQRRMQIDGLARGLPDVSGLLGVQMQRLDVAAERFANAGGRLVSQRQQDVALLAARLKSPDQVISAAAGRVDSEARAMQAAVARLLGRQEDRFAGVAGRLSVAPVNRAMRDGRETLDDLSQRLAQGMRRPLDDAAGRLKQLGGLLESYSFERVLERGFVVVRDENGDPVTSAKKTKTGDAIALQFADGEANAVIAGSGSKPRPKAKPEPVIHQQGKLL
ncbi:MAG: exodeoxyribonuclease VII large subunit [Proteobacteria bacterium]|nr:exodeoxyribonuclease VII large subunit [Pseudomonadota bacterium]